MYTKNKFSFGYGQVVGFSQGIFFYYLMTQYDSIWTKGLFLLNVGLKFGETIGLYTSLKNIEKFEKPQP